MPVRFNWSGSDATSGVARYETSLRIDSGRWSAPAAASGSSATSNLYGHVYRLAVRAVDMAGNVGAWAYGPPFRIAGVSQAYSTIRYAGTWSTSTSSTWWGSTAKSSSRAGSTVRYTFTGKSISWVALKAANRGKAQVYVNGVLRATVNLYSATTQSQVLVWTATYADIGQPDGHDQGARHRGSPARRRRRLHRRELTGTSRGGPGGVLLAVHLCPD